MDIRADAGRIESGGRTRKRRQAAIVPARSVAGRALIAVVAIMTFLASLTIGGVDLVRSAASGWQADIVREVTIQVRPIEGRNTEAEVTKAAEIARGVQGVTAVRPFTEAESAQLLEPWLGSGLDLTGLPVPRMIVVSVGAQGADLAALKSRLQPEVTGATVDDHRQWSQRLRSMAGVLIGIGLAILALVVAATVLSVLFATRGAMSGNHEIIEVLNLVGATDSFIAREFQRRFLRFGLFGGLFGGGAAILFFAALAILADTQAATSAASQAEILFGRFALSAGSYASIVAVSVGIAMITAMTSRLTVKRYLRKTD